MVVARLFMQSTKLAEIPHCRIAARPGGNSLSVVLIGYVLYRQSTPKSIVTAPLDLEKADAKLCQLGSCAPGAEPAPQ